MLQPERKTEDEIERFGAVVVLLNEPFKTALKFLYGSARRYIAEEIAPQNALLRKSCHARFEGVILGDGTVEIDGDQAEGQLIESCFIKLEDLFNVDGHARGDSAPAMTIMREQPPAEARFTEAELERLSKDGWTVDLASHDVVPLDGPWLPIVVSGILRVYRHAAFIRDVTLFLATAGDGLGASRIFGERGIESGAEALGEARVLRLTPEEFERHASVEPELYIRVARTLGLRTLRVHERIEAIGRAGVESRVAATLLELSDDCGNPCADGVRLDLPLSQEDLARLAGMTRESCSSILADFGRRGIVRGKRLRGLTILDRGALAESAAG